MSESALAGVSPRRSAALRWPIVVPTAAMSLVTMPITAIWFLLLAPVIGILGATTAIVARSPSTKDRIVSTAGSLAVGLLAGPLVYVGMAIAL